MSVKIYGVKCVASLRFWENKGWIDEIDPYGWFQCILGTSSAEDQKMMKGKLIGGKILRVG